MNDTNGKGTGKLSEMTEYCLEVYEPGSADDVLAAFRSTTPFMAIRPGDILNPYAWGSYTRDKVLRVVNVEHGVWETGGRITHKILVFTREVRATDKARLIEQI